MATTDSYSTVRTRVFVASFNPDFDYAGAKPYGEIIPVLSAPVNVKNPGHTMVVISAQLRIFRDEDYLLLSGTAVANVLCYAVLAPKLKFLNLLLFDAKEEQYYAYRMETATARITPVERRP